MMLTNTAVPNLGRPVPVIGPFFSFSSASRQAARKPGGSATVSAAGAAYGDRLELLRPHHRADARAARGTGLVVDDGGEADETLAGGADAHELEAATELGVEAVFGVACVLPPHASSRTQLRLPVVDYQHGRFPAAPSRTIAS